MPMLLYRRGVLAALAVVFLTAAATTPRLVTRAQNFHAVRSFGVGSSKREAEIKLSYPSIAGGPSIAARSALNHAVLNFVLGNEFGQSRKPASSPKALAADFFTAYENYYASSRKMHTFAQPYLLERAVRILNTGPHVVSLQMDEFSDMGGAHPNSLTLLANVDALSGKVLTIDDLIIPGSKTALMRIAERYFRNARSIPQNQRFTRSGDFFSEQGKFVLPKEVAIESTGLRLYYNSYEVASYVDGPTDFTIPFSALAGVIRPNLP